MYSNMFNLYFFRVFSFMNELNQIFIIPRGGNFDATSGQSKQK